jgi:hypothetical protein
VINLFDTKNIYNVFPKTGSAEDDGNEDIPYLEEVYGKQVSQLNKLINLYNPDEGQQTFFGPPRQIGFGIKLNY